MHAVALFGERIGSILGEIIVIAVVPVPDKQYTTIPIVIRRNLADEMLLHWC